MERFFTVLHFYSLDQYGNCFQKGTNRKWQFKGREGSNHLASNLPSRSAFSTLSSLHMCLSFLLVTSFSISQTQDVCYTKLKEKKKSIDTNGDIEAMTCTENNYQWFLYSVDQETLNCKQDNTHFSSITS